MLKQVVVLIAFAISLPARAADPPADAGAPIVDAGGSTTPTQKDMALDDLTKMKALEEARKAAFDAAKAASESQKAAIEAKTAAGTAKIGTVTGQTSITGAVTMGTYTAKAEALLLVTRSTRLAAQEIAPKLKQALTGRESQPILVLSGTADLSTGDALQFDIQLHNLRASMALVDAYYAQAKAVDSPRIKVKSAGAGGDGSERMAPLAAAGAIVDLAAKLGSYFAADYAFGSVDLPATPLMVETAIVGSLREQGLPNPIIIPSNFVVSDGRPLFESLSDLQSRYLKMVAEQSEAKSRSGELAKDPGAKAVSAASLYNQVDATASKVTTTYDKLMGDLAAAGTDGKEPFAVRVVRQKIIQNALGSRTLLLLLNSQEAAAFYTKKSLWTFLGGVPLYTMGGVSLTYTLYENNGGAILAAGTVGRHGGYRSVRDVEKLFP